MKSGQGSNLDIFLEHKNAGSGSRVGGGPLVSNQIGRLVEVKRWGDFLAARVKVWPPTQSFLCAFCNIFFSLVPSNNSLVSVLDP